MGTTSIPQPEITAAYVWTCATDFRASNAIAPTLLDAAAALPRLLADIAWALILRLLHHPLVAGRHVLAVGRIEFTVREAFGADDQSATDLAGLRAPSAEDTAVLPVVADDYLFCRRPPVLSAVDVAFRAGGITDNWGAI